MEVTARPKLHMVDLIGQYQKIKREIDEALREVLETAMFIKGPVVEQFEKNLANYLNVKHVIGCANGTDALQIALMALGLKPGDEVIVPSFTYVATAEVIALLRLKPIMVDVDPEHFNITPDIVKKAITKKTKAVVPVHLFGQSADMEGIMEIAHKEGIYVVEDNAQAIGSEYTYKSGNKVKTGTIGDVGCTSFFPSKNLGCYGDGGALFTNNDDLAEKIRMIANHGQSVRYYHDRIGVNSRLDALQAAVLNVKLKYLNDYSAARVSLANNYDQFFSNYDQITIPKRVSFSTHVFHQYTLKIGDGRRDQLVDFLKEQNIPHGIYYPVPLNKQKAFLPFVDNKLELPVTERLCNQVISLPMHTEMTKEGFDYITGSINQFFNN